MLTLKWTFFSNLTVKMQLRINKKPSIDVLITLIMMLIMKCCLMCDSAFTERDLLNVFFTFFTNTDTDEALRYLHLTSRHIILLCPM